YTARRQQLPPVLPASSTASDFPRFSSICLRPTHLLSSICRYFPPPISRWLLLFLPAVFLLSGPHSGSFPRFFLSPDSFLPYPRPGNGLTAVPRWLSVFLPHCDYFSGLPAGSGSAFATRCRPSARSPFPCTLSHSYPSPYSQDRKSGV